MFYYLMEKADWLNTVIIVLVMVVIFVTAHYFVHRSRTGEKPENEVPSLIGHLVGMLYSVLLAFVAVSSWSNFDRAMQNTETEENSLGELYRISFGFPTEMQKLIQKNIIHYSELMISSEWPAMQHGEQSAEAYKVAGAILSDIRKFEPTTISQTNLQQQALSAVNIFLESRRHRLSANQEELPIMLIIILLIGAALMVGTTFFVYQSNLRRQLFLTAILSSTIGLIFSMVIEFEYPYRGTLNVPITGWESLIKEVKHSDLH